MMDIQRLVSNGKISKLKNNLDKEIFQIYFFSKPIFFEKIHKISIFETHSFQKYSIFEQKYPL